MTTIPTCTKCTYVHQPTHIKLPAFTVFSMQSTIDLPKVVQAFLFKEAQKQVVSKCSHWQHSVNQKLFFAETGTITILFQLDHKHHTCARTFLNQNPLVDSKNCSKVCLSIDFANCDNLWCREQTLMSRAICLLECLLFRQWMARLNTLSRTKAKSVKNGQHHMANP